MVAVCILDPFGISRILNEKYSDHNENWYQSQFRYGEFKNRGHEFWKSLEESEEEEKEEKTKNTRIATKIGTKVNFGTTNSTISSYEIPII